MDALPTRGRSPDALRETLSQLRGDDLPRDSGKTFGHVFDADAEIEALAREVYADFLGENGLDPTLYPSLLVLEREVVRAVASLLGGDERATGTFTSGGTESIFCAVLAARDAARTERGPGRLEVILPSTAHPAFHKAAHYLDLDVVLVEVARARGCVDPAAVAARVNGRTALIVGSAPAYATSRCDPIAALGAVAEAHGVRLHVDACMGGMVMPFLREWFDIPAFDLSVPGVSSLSVDLHKYGYCPKGASLVLYPDCALRRPQLFVGARWAGYPLVNPAVQSSRSGGALAAAWTVLGALGVEGYRVRAEALWQATETICDGIESIDGLELLARPHMPALSFTSSRHDVFALVEAMRARGWHLQAQLGFGDIPASVHLTVVPNAVRRVDALITDLADVTPGIAPPDAGLARAIGQLDAATLASLDLEGALAALGLSSLLQRGDAPPRASARVNAVLDALPRDVAARLLGDFANQLYR